MDEAQRLDGSSQSDHSHVDTGRLLICLEGTEYTPALWKQLADVMFNELTVESNAYAWVLRLINSAIEKQCFPAELFEFVANIELRRCRKGSPVLSQSMEVPYAKALEQLAKIGLLVLGDCCNPDKARKLLCFLALSKGLNIYAIALNEYSERELAEFFFADDSDIV